jgi:hypothetical protein
MKPVAAVLAGLVVLLVVALLFGSTRTYLLGVGVKAADRFLPGQLTAGRAAWPETGHLVFENLLWLAEGEAPADTLLHLERLELGFDARALRGREGRVDSLVVDLRRLDVPGLAALFAPDSSATVAESDATGAPDEAGAGAIPWLDAGPLPRVPSVAAGSLDIRGRNLVLAEGWVVDEIRLRGRAEARAGRRPEAEVSHLSGGLRGVLSDSTGSRTFSVVLPLLAARAHVDPQSLASAGYSGISASLDSLEMSLAAAVLDTTLILEDVALSASGDVERGVRARFAVAEISGRARGTAVGGETWEAALARLGMEIAVEAEPGDGGGVRLASATVDDLVLEGGQARLGRRLTVDDVDFRAGAALGGAEPWLIRVEHLGADFSGAVGDSSGSGEWGLALTHLGLAMEARMDPEAEGLDRLVGVRLDSLNVDLRSRGELAVQAGWQPDEPLHLDANGDLGREGSALVADLDLEFALPGTSYFPALLPEDFPHEAFGAVAGRMDLAGRYDDPRLTADLRLDLGETAWLDAGRAALHVDLDRERLAAGDLSDLVVRADSLALGIYGTGLLLDGGVERGDLDLRMVLGVDDARLVRAFIGAEGEEDTLAVGVDLVLAGDLDHPVVSGYVEGTARLEELGIDVPALRLDVDGNDRHVDAALRAGGGLAFGSTRLDSVTASVSGDRDTTGTITGGMALEAWMEQFHLAVGGTTAGDSVRTVVLDSLVIRRDERRFALEAPVTLTMGPGTRNYELTPLVITGDPGEVMLRGRWDEAGFDFAAALDLLLDEEALQRFGPSPLWSVDGGMDLSLDTQVELEGTPDSPRFDGYAELRLLPHRDRPTLGVDLDFALAQGDTAGLAAALSVLSADTLLVSGRALWPGRADLARGAWVPDPDRNVTLDIPTTNLALQRFNRLLPEDVGLNGGLEVGLDVDLPVAGGEAGENIAGRALERSTVQGAVRSQEIRVTLPNRSRVELGLDLAAEGSLADPTVRGRVDIKSAFFRIPEIPRSLHPVDGPSLLWAMRDSALARLDSTAAAADSFSVFVTPDNPFGLRPARPAFLPELDVKLVFPRNVRINGYGMDIELEGDIHVARGYDKDGFPGPKLTGHVRVRSGSIQFMNRVFTPRRGNVDFVGDVPPNPHLDMLIEANVSGTLVKILVSGRATDPVIDLTSEPEMPAEDVMAVLLFGRPLNDLDNAQRDHMQDEGDPARELRENLAGLAMVFGTAGLQNRMSNTLGVDMVQLGSDSSGGSTLMVGKFISPELMVKYHASLEKSGTYFMTLEYTLSRYFKLVSTYGQGEEASGAEIQWSRRY